MTAPSRSSYRYLRLCRIAAIRHRFGGSRRAAAPPSAIQQTDTTQHARLGKKLATTDSPAAARRRLRFALRNAREAKQLTQAEIADKLEWSVSKVNRIENGDVTISATDLRALISLLEVTDGTTVEELTSYARAARRRGWWDDPQHRPHLTDALRQLIQYEAEATAIRCFQPTLIPGVLQTAEYGRAVLEFWKDLPQETRVARLALRASRNRGLFGRSGGPQYLLLLDESVVLRHVGGPAVMAAQLRFVLNMIETAKLIVRVIPFVDGAVMSQVGDFTILDLAEDENAILYREVALDDNIRDAHEIVERYRRTFEQMWEVALTPDESTRLIEGHAAILTTSIERTKRNI